MMSADLPSSLSEEASSSTSTNNEVRNLGTQYILSSILIAMNVYINFSPKNRLIWKTTKPSPATVP